MTAAVPQGREQCRNPPGWRIHMTQRQTRARGTSALRGSAHFWRRSCASLTPSGYSTFCPNLKRVFACMHVARSLNKWRRTCKIPFDARLSTCDLSPPTPGTYAHDLFLKARCTSPGLCSQRLVLGAYVGQHVSRPHAAFVTRPCQLLSTCVRR